MDIIQVFKAYLTYEKKVSPITTKNYVSDLKKFITWFESNYKEALDPALLTSDIINLFSSNSNLTSARSKERYISTLRKFCTFLTEKSYLSTNPFDQIKEEQNISKDKDPCRLKGFRDFLYVNNAKRSTIKNYMVDINAFTSWLEKATSTRSLNGIHLVGANIINLYKDRLITNLGLSPKSVNRKLSSIRNYLDFARQNTTTQNVSIQDTGLIDAPKTTEHRKNLRLEDFTFNTNLPSNAPENYSSIAPIRLAERIATPYTALEDKAATKIADLIQRKTLEKKALAQEKQKPEVVRNISKLFFAPEEVSLSNFTKSQKIIHHLRYTRPNWYKAYHKYPISSYLHLGVLVFYASILGYILYGNFLASETGKVEAVTSPPRMLSFQGRLTDADDLPITSPTYVRFQIYDDATATGSGNLLWQELNRVTPDELGVFSILLGNGGNCSGQPLSPQETSCPIPNTLFQDNEKLFLGITIENTEELEPRQQIASVAFASNSESLQGMRPITDTLAGNTNVILALDSSGNLTMDGTANPTFSATGGQFKLSGEPLLLTTNVSTNADVIIEPDGIGNIDLRRPLVNNGTGGSILSGAVEINDSFAVLATESARAAFIVNNDSTGGDIFVASSSGTARFIIENGGDISVQPGISIDTFSTGSLLIGNSVATSVTIGRSGNGITLPGFSGQNGVLYGTYGTGELSQSTTSSSGLCLISGSTSPSWSSCTTAPSTYWNQSNGLLFANNSTVDLAIGGQSTSSAKFAILNVNGNGPVTASVSGNVYILPRNGAGGNLGVGTNDPQSQVHVYSTADGNILRLQDADGTCDHDPEAGSETVTCSSDQRLKSNIADSDEVLQDILKYRIRSYTVNASGDLQTGVIAQEVQRIFPEKVKIGPNDYLMVEQPSIWVLTKGLQELFDKIERLSLSTGGKILDSISIGEDSITIAGINLREYITKIVDEVLYGSKSVSPIARISEVKTDIVSPLTEDSKISLGLKNSKLEIRNSNNASESAVVASIDNMGNATFSGSVLSQSVTATSSSFISSDIKDLTSENISVSGTLHAQRITAASIDGLDQKIAYAAQTYLASSASADINFDTIMSGRGSISFANVVDIKSISSDFGTFREGLISFGPATFGQVTALDSISIGNNFLIGKGTIDTLGFDLEIQPLRQGAVSFLAGAVRIETDGKLIVRGNAEIAGDLTVGGKIKTNVISPLPDRDLVIGATDSAILSINKTGDVTSSGSATFNKFNLSFVSPAYAISDTEVASTGSAGLTSIKPYRTELTIYNPNVTEKSLIYITPVGRTYNQVLYMLRQSPGESFTVGIDAPVSREVQFNWIIVN